MKRSEFKKLTKSKERNTKVVKMVTTTGLSVVLIAPSILGSISVLAAEETTPTEQVETVPEALQVAETQAPIQAEAQSYSTTINWVVNQNDANVSFGDGLTGTLSGTDNLYFATETSGFNTGLNGNQVGTQTFTFDSGLLGEEEGTSYTITLVVTDEATAPAEKPKAPQSVSATDDGKFVYASAEQGTSVFVKDANGTIISSYTVANGLDTPVQISLNRALTKGEKVQVVAVNQMTDKQSDPTWFTFKEAVSFSNKVIGIDLDTSEELYSYNETGLEGETKEVGYSTIEGFELAEGETPIKTMTFGVNGDVTFYYTKKIVTPPEKEKTKLTVDFIDMETGEKVSESVISEVEQGKETTVKAKDIKGFVLQGDATVKVTPTEANHTITFAYKKEIVNVVLVNATNVKFVEKSDGKQITATVPKGLTLVIVKNGTVIGKSSNGLFARLLTDEVSINLDTRVAKGETIEYYTEDDKGNSSATANLTREGQEPVDPTEPTEPTNPTNPVDPTDDPSTPKPAEPTNPTEPSTPNPVVPTTPSTTDTKDTTKPVTKVDDKNEKLIPQLGETSNMLTTIGMLISASMGFILTKRKK